MRWFLATGLMILCGGVPAADPPPAKKPLPTTVEEFAAVAKECPKPPWMSFNGQPQRVSPTHLDATVVRVTTDTITVLPKGGEKAVTYPAHELLMTGAVCHWTEDPRCYLLEDVKREDVVVIGVGVADKEKGEECFYIQMYWRPGGKIPPSRKPSKFNQYHEKRQEQVEYDERGEYSPSQVKDRLELVRFNAKNGLPPPPPLPEKKPLVRAKLPPDEKDDKK